MLDRAARDQMVEAIEAYMNDEIKTFAFDERLFTIKTKDPAVNEAACNLWFCYSDVTDHPIHATRETWNFMYRVILFLRSDAELEIRKIRQWSVLQIASLVMLLSLALAWRFGSNGLLGIAWLAIGIAAWMIKRQRSLAYSQNETDGWQDFPFNSSLEIFRAARSIPRLHKKPFPQELALRGIQRGWLSRIANTPIHLPEFIMLPLAFCGWLIMLPLVLLSQLFPVSYRQRTIRFQPD